MNLAWTGFFTRLNAANEAYAQYGDGNLAAVWVTGNDRNVAVVDGQLCTATAGPGLVGVAFAPDGFRTPVGYPACEILNSRAVLGFATKNGKTRSPSGPEFH